MYPIHTCTECECYLEIQFLIFLPFSCSIGENVKHLIDRPDGTYCFREQSNKVYYMSEKVLKLAENLGRDRLVSVGCSMGKFSKTNKFKFHITALNYLAPYAQ